ncbi:hypothetical protein [Patulibacter minatonensis]|uniref:hypothetical protein n=1 Tax=Patulibacter minatonensis TaxID=298163 RepID=UPI00047E189B|nr:hypothetical protein [Patulibacter minatonensis]
MRAMNLLPVEERGGARAAGAPSRLNAVHGIAGVGALVTIGMLGTWAMAKQDTSDAKQSEAAAIAQSAASQAQVTRLAPVVAFDARRASREAAVLQLAAGRTDWAGVLRATAGSLPSNVTVSTLKLAAADASAAGATTTSAATPAGLGGSGSVTLSVCADTQPRVATTLRRFRALPQVADVALSQTSRAGKSADGGSGTAGAQTCTGVQADAALGLSAETVIDGASTATPASTTGTATPGATPTATTTTPGAATPAASTTTGASR